MKTILTLALAAVAVAAAPAPTHAADPIVLRFAYPAPPQGPANQWGFTPWAQEVLAASNGTVEVKIFPGGSIADFNKVYDRVLNGVADIGYGIFGPVSTEFPKAMVASLPFEATNVEEAALALWRLYDKGVIADELGRVKPLALFNFSDTGLHTRKPIKTMADVQGLKLSVGTRALGEMMERLGATPIQLPPSEYYSSNQRGLIDGSATSWPALLPFKLQEVTNFHLDVGFGQAPAFVVMNKESFAKLPEAGRKAIDSLSGESFTRRMAGAAMRMETEFRAAVAAMPNQTISKLDPAEEKRWAQRVAPVTEHWIKTTPNGAAVLAAYRAEIVKARAELAK
jgi:TRAP-type C4-dicarboxylate transport system substrate-binding protein